MFCATVSVVQRESDETYLLAISCMSVELAPLQAARQNNKRSTCWQAGNAPGILVGRLLNLSLNFADVEDDVFGLSG